MFDLYNTKYMLKYNSPYTKYSNFDNNVNVGNIEQK